ncbi:hypothetical protein BCR34DRAFT_662103 [Clohesyomyces aquaticus]|uniref:Uncharacterized protein n=1 Tax=Clohesyomyces aquaticus TaxID=1231657 RepID=A0A1Y1ZYE8_9PLEO|nr:hypothetical protein BCR34DRAFT_662103 [Clohesyomyces aquaticus]
MDPINPASSEVGGGGVSIYDDAQLRLFGGLEQGFKNVMDKLSNIHDEIQQLPRRTTEGLSNQHGNRADSQEIDHKCPEGADATSVVNDVMTANQNLQNEKSELETRIQEKDQTITASAEKESELRREVLELKRKIAHLERKEVEFRDIIISNATVQQVTDQDVIQAFSELRQTVQQLAKNPALDLAHSPLPPTPNGTDSNQADRHFYSKLRTLSLKPRDVGFRVRMRIWEILHTLVFTKTIFGLKVPLKDDEAEDLWKMEIHLGRFEQYLFESSKVHDNMIADWRVCTLQCVRTMEKAERYSDYVAGKLEEGLEPLARKALKSQKAELFDKILEVCRKAVALKMLMQRSKEGYSVITLHIKEFPLYSGVGHTAESMGVEGGKASDASDDIAYVLFGALTKRPNSINREGKVLLKAEVILKKKR